MEQEEHQPDLLGGLFGDDEERRQSNVGELPSLGKDEEVKEAPGLAHHKSISEVLKELQDEDEGPEVRAEDQVVGTELHLLEHAHSSGNLGPEQSAEVSEVEKQ